MLTIQRMVTLPILDLLQRAEERHAETVEREGSAIWKAEQEKFERLQQELRNNVALQNEKLRRFKDALEHLNKTRDEYKDLVLHIVIAHYNEKLDLVSDLLGEIMANPAMQTMRSHVFFFSKAEDQVMSCQRWDSSS